jgi:hypothetical protein
MLFLYGRAIMIEYLSDKAPKVPNQNLKGYQVLEELAIMALHMAIA